MGEIKGYIKFKDKKAIMKPLENQEGPVIMAPAGVQRQPRAMVSVNLVQ